MHTRFENDEDNGADDVTLTVSVVATSDGDIPIVNDDVGGNDVCVELSNGKVNSRGVGIGDGASVTNVDDGVACKVVVVASDVIGSVIVDANVVNIVATVVVGVGNGVGCNVVVVVVDAVVTTTTGVGNGVMH
jgi:hypothetical protein